MIESMTYIIDYLLKMDFVDWSFNMDDKTIEMGYKQKCHRAKKGIAISKKRYRDAHELEVRVED